MLEAFGAAPSRSPVGVVEQLGGGHADLVKSIDSTGVSCSS